MKVVIGDATLYLGDCREILPALQQVDAVITDPPYGEGMGFDGDDCPRSATLVVKQTFSALKEACRPGAYASCFWTMRSLDFLLDAVRSARWSYLRTLSMHVPGDARPHLAWIPRVQPIVLFRNGMRASDLHDVFSVWLKTAIQDSGLSAGQIASALGVDSRLVMKWSRYRDPSWCLPTERHYPALKKLLNLRDTFDEELMSRERQGKRIAPRRYRHDLYQVAAGRPATDHPSEKPLHVVEHLCAELADYQETALDPFMGSGTTGVACARLGRSFVGIEINPKHFETACRRIDEAQRQGRLFDAKPPKPEQLTLDGAA